MNKYFVTPALFIRFSGISFRKKIILVFSFLLLFSFFNSVSAQWVQYGTPSAEPFNDIFFVNDNTGWVCQPFGGTPNLLKTTNGGLNWTDCSTPTTPYSLHFINENTGFAIGLISYKTTNGGLNWNSMAFAGEQISFANNLTGWVINPDGFIYKTTNAGDSWGSMNIGNPQLTDVYFLNSSTGWVLSGGSNAVLKTTNGGANWNVFGLGISPVFYFSIQFSDENNGRVLGNNVFLKTTNGGQNWFTGNSPANQFLDDQYFINSTTGWVVMRFGGVYFTSNGGTNWLQQSTGLQSFAMCFTQQGIGYVCGGTNNSGIIAKTTNGGFDLPAPTNLAATAVSTSQINLSWTDNSLIEDKFIIERSPNSVNWSVIDSVNAGVTIYANTGLTTNTGYFYRVKAKKLFFTGAPSNTPLAFTFIDSPVLTTPGDNYIQTTNTPNLAWTAVSFASTYSLQVASDTVFSNIVYSITEGGLLNKTIPAGILQNSTKYYWRAKCSNASTQSAYTSYRLFTVQYPDYGHNISSSNNLYYFANSTPGANLAPSKPEYSWRDTAGSISLILNNVAQVPLSAGSLDDGRFDLAGILPGGNSIRFFGTNYQNVYIGTNGIIGFTAFQPVGAGYYQPASGLPQGNITNAIFPLWKDLNYNDTDVPSNRLCYKVTSNEIIITYMHAPNYNSATIDPNDYVSFQVIIKHSAVNTVNSNIKVQYNYDETGSSFISKYNGNTLAPHIIGLQAANSSSQILQYRYVDINPAIIVSGPMFGSNLALELGPNANVLPVELASFTSEVAVNNVKLNWSTVSEENNSGFEIERRELSGTLGVNVNGEWKKAGFVNGSGTTSETKNYSYEDRNVQSGNYKYRLKQIDYNGNFEYHELSSDVIVGVPNKFALNQNYPNPFNPSTKINFEIPNNSKVVLQVYDVTGRMISELVHKEMNAGYYTIDFNASNLSSGIYFYRLAANDFVQTKKMLLVK